MANKTQNRQKKLAKQKKKRAVRKKAMTVVKNTSINASNYARYPIHECLAPENLFELGIGNITVTRRLPDGSIAISSFIVDVHCLGVKNALFYVMDEYKYENEFKVGLTQSHEGVIENIHPACAKKIINGAIRYAKQLGFQPHPDYFTSVGIFGDIESTACPESYEYGKDGKPFYMRGPYETISQANKIVEKLAKNCGQGNFDYVVMSDEQDFF